MARAHLGAVMYRRATMPLRRPRLHIALLPMVRAPGIFQRAGVGRPQHALAPSDTESVMKKYRVEHRVADMLRGKVCCPECGREGSERRKNWACRNGQCDVYRFLRDGTVVMKGWIKRK